MRIQPRQELLAIWKAITKWSVDDRKWTWDGRGGRNSISDAELLLCLLHPLTKLDRIRFSQPDSTSHDVLTALAPLGNEVEIPQRVLRLSGEYLDEYTDSSTGLPVFGGGSYFVALDPDDQAAPTPRQQELEVVDSYATSVVLTTAIITFLREYQPKARGRSQAQIGEVEAAARRRLTAAMVGLQRSFALSVFHADSREGRALCRTVSQRDEFPSTIVGDIRAALQDVVVGLRGLGGTISEQAAMFAENPDRLFECGWSWGTVRDAPVVPTREMGEFSAPGFAEPAPYLYFTVVAVDGIRDLFTGQAAMQGLLNEEQQQIASTLSRQWELARRYWSTIATLGDPWPLQDPPWRTTDEDETDYYTLLVTSLVLRDQEGRGVADEDLSRLGEVLEELAGRGRLTRRALAEDPALTLHDPGARIALVGTERVEEGAPRLGWQLADHATLVLGRTLSVVERARDPRLRAQLLDLADAVWAHIERRRLSTGRAADLWDQPANAFPALPDRGDAPSWYFTTRVVQCLDTAADLTQGRSLPIPRLTETAADLLVEAERAFDFEQLLGSTQSGPALQDSLRRQATNLARARDLVARRSGAAIALLLEVLRELDKLAAAREPEAGD